jgi:hypothetical protein
MAYKRINKKNVPNEKKENLSSDQDILENSSLSININIPLN